MKEYIGTKTITAKPMTLGRYNKYRGWDLPENEKPLTKGYLVEYPASTANPPNHPKHEGYISWSPKAVFEQAYAESGNWTFGEALEAMKNGSKVQRQGWNGKGMFVFLVPSSTFNTNREPLTTILGKNTTANYQAHIDMYTVDKTIVPWLCSQSDMLASDWQLA